MSVEKKCVGSGHPTAGMLLDLVLRSARGEFPGHALQCALCHLAALLRDGHLAEEMCPGPLCCTPSSHILLWL